MPRLSREPSETTRSRPHVTTAWSWRQLAAPAVSRYRLGEGRRIGRNINAVWAMGELATPPRIVRPQQLPRLALVVGPTLRPDEYSIAVQLRICATVRDDECLGHATITRWTDLDCTPSSARHYVVRDELLRLAHLADPSVEAEVTGLVPKVPLLRPADIFTSAAIPGCLAALDVGVTSPHAAGAGDDCVESMALRTRNEYESHRQAMAESNVVYRPVISSAYRRVHPDAQVVMRTLAVRAARRCGFADHRQLLKQARAAVGVALWRRAASMVHMCLPPLSPEERKLLLSHH